MQSGTAITNSSPPYRHATPFGGTQESGLGVRHGPQGIRKYSSQQTILVTRFGPKREPTMFPNKAWKAKLFERLMVALWGRRKRRR